MVEDQSCRVPWLNAHAICSVFNEYSAIHIYGDSFVRQMVMGLFLVLREDLRYGAVSRQTVGGAISSTEKCNCDGQFSEYPDCRRGNDGAFNTRFDPSEKMCTSNLNFNFPTFRFDCNYAGGAPSNFSYVCAAERTRPVFIFLSQRLHYKYDAERTILEYYNTSLSNLQTSIASCPYDVAGLVKVVVMGGGASTHAFEVRWPHQETSHVLRFNARMKSYLSDTTRGVAFLDTFNMTQEAVQVGQRSSDGLHLLSDVNIVRAVTTVHLMNLMLDPASERFAFHP